MADTWRFEGLDEVVLEERPRLASWDAMASPAQAALRAYLDRLQSAADRPDLSAFHLIVGDVTEGSPGHDLDNFLYPVAKRFGANRFDLVRGSKRRSRGHRLVVGVAVSGDPPRASDGWSSVVVGTEGSTDSRAWKEDVHAQVARVVHTPETGPVEMEIVFRIGPSRTWVNLWKPAIDSLGPILGEGRRPFMPEDDMIVELGLHRQVDPGMGFRVELGIWGRAASGTGLIG